MEQMGRTQKRTHESVSTPPAVETNLGVLAFPLGVPTEATAAVVYGHVDYLHAVHAFLNAIPGSTRGRSAAATWRLESATTMWSSGRK